MPTADPHDPSSRAPGGPDLDHDPDRDDPTTELLRRTLGAAADRTAIDDAEPTFAAELVGIGTARSSAGAGRSRWLAAAAATVVVLGAVGLVATRSDPGTDVGVGGPGAGTTPGSSPGSTPPTAPVGGPFLPEWPSPDGPVTTATTVDPRLLATPARPEGDQWLPVLSYQLPNGTVVTAPAKATLAPEGPADVIPDIGYFQRITNTDVDLTVTVIGWNGTPSLDDVFGADAPSVTTIGDPSSDLFVYSVEGDAGGVGMAHLAEDAPRTVGVAIGERFAAQFVGTASDEVIDALLTNLRIGGWQDGRVIPMDGSVSTPVAGSADIWPTEAPADYCTGWKAFMDVQFTAPGPASVQTDGFRRYTTQLEALAPGDLPASWRSLREAWLAPDKAGVDDGDDGSMAALDHIHQVSTAACG